MKRLALAILVVTVVVATVFAILNRPGAEATPLGATITVNSVKDNNARDGELTLREAMMLATGDLSFIVLSEEECAQVSTLVWWVTFCAIEAGNPPGAVYADTIEFASLGPVALITLESGLPILWGGDDTIDASSSSTTWVVDGNAYTCFQITSNNNVVKGLEITECATGVWITGQNNTVGGSIPGEGNVISGNWFCGVQIANFGANGNVVKGNYIGTDPSGTVAVPNADGVCITPGPQDNTVGGSSPGEGNVISGNHHYGVRIWNADTNGNVVKGNYIGTDASGTVGLPNGSDGVSIIAGAQDNTVGGSNPGEHNVISGNAGCGVFIGEGWLHGPDTDGNTVKGNLIGTNASGTVAVPNYDGVCISGNAHNNTVGGSNSGEGNVISGNDEAGVLISDAGTDGNAVEGNYIGTNAAGDAALPNSYGVHIRHGPQDNTVGGSKPGEGNIISGNMVGVGIEGSGTNGNVIEGNYIGTDAWGTAALPNGHGVWIGYGAQDNTVGGSGPGEHNVISGNTFYGVQIGQGGTTGNMIKGNYIGTDAWGTAALPNQAGVSIINGAQNNSVGGTAAGGEGNVIAHNNEDGVHVDAQHGDTTGNTIRGNSIHSNGGQGIDNIDGGNEELEPPAIESAGSVFGTACADCTIDVYSDEEDEGRVYEGFTTADGDGNWSFSGTPEGPNITATATDSDGNTSEFSEPLEPPWPAPSPTPTPTPSPTATPSPTPVSDSDGDTVADHVEEALGSDPNDSDSTPEHAAMPGTCSDGVDNDGDGLIDADDEGCSATRTIVWGPGWHNETWSGSSTPEEAFSCAAGNYAAAYRYVGGGFQRYFPDRLDISNMTDLQQYDTFFILITDDVTCEMPVADPSGTERTLDWSVGWHNEGWTGPDSTNPENAFACADGSYAAAYRYVGGAFERYFPDRPDISNMGALDQYDAFLILVTAPVSCTMPISP